MGLFQTIAEKNQMGTSTETTTVPKTTTGGVFSRVAEKQSQPSGVRKFVGDIAKPFEEIGGEVLGRLTGIRPDVKTGGIASTGVKPITSGKQLAGDILEGVSYAIPGARIASGAIKTGVAKNIGLGALSGEMYGAGQGLQEGKTVGEALTSAVPTALAGGTAMGTIPLVGKAPKAIQEFIAPTEKQLESKLLSKFSKGVKPTILGKGTTGKLEQYNDNVIKAVKTIKENEPNISFLTDEGESIIGQSPKSLKQLTDAVEQTKKTIFTQYDTIAREAGGAGLNVELKPIASELDNVINNKALNISNPNAIAYAKLLKDRLTTANKIDASTAQEVIQNYNKSLEAFYKNPTYDNASQAAIDAMVANNMRKSLDEGIEGITGKAYQELKNKYSSLKSVEKDIVKAFLRDERKGTKGLIDFTDILSGGQVINGIISLNPATIGGGIASKAIASFYKKLNDPNRAIEKVFNIAGKLPELPKKQVTPRLQLPAPTSKVRSEIMNQGVIPLSKKTQSKADEEMIQKFGQRNQISQTKNPIAKVIPKTGESAQSIKNNKNGIIPASVPDKLKDASGKLPALGAMPLLGEKLEPDNQEPFMKPDPRVLRPSGTSTEDLKKAIANNETSGVKNPYSFRKFSGSKQYGEDLGKYQITTARLSEKSKEFLGRKVTPDEFISSPSLQDKFIKAQIDWQKANGLNDAEVLATHRHGWGNMKPEQLKKAVSARQAYINKALSSLK